MSRPNYNIRKLYEHPSDYQYPENVLKLPVISDGERSAVEKAAATAAEDKQIEDYFANQNKDRDLAEFKRRVEAAADEDVAGGSASYPMNRHVGPPNDPLDVGGNAAEGAFADLDFIPGDPESPTMLLSDYGNFLRGAAEARIQSAIRNAKYERMTISAMHEEQLIEPLEANRWIGRYEIHERHMDRELQELRTSPEMNAMEEFNRQRLEDLMTKNSEGLTKIESILRDVRETLKGVNKRLTQASEELKEPRKLIQKSFKKLYSKFMNYEDGYTEAIGDVEMQSMDRESVDERIRAMEATQHDEEAMAEIASSLEPSMRMSSYFEGQLIDKQLASSARMSNMFFGYYYDNAGIAKSSLGLKFSRFGEGLVGEETFASLGDVIAELGTLVNTSFEIITSLAEFALGLEVFAATELYQLFSALLKGNIDAIDSIFSFGLLDLLGEVIFDDHILANYPKQSIKTKSKNKTGLALVQDSNNQAFTYNFWAKYFKIYYERLIHAGIRPNDFKKVPDQQLLNFQQGMYLTPGIDNPQTIQDLKELKQQPGKYGEYISGGWDRVQRVNNFNNQFKYPAVLQFPKPRVEPSPYGPAGPSVASSGKWPATKKEMKKNPTSIIDGPGLNLRTVDPTFWGMIEKMIDTGRWGPTYDYGKTKKVRENARESNINDFNKYMKWEEFDAGVSKAKLMNNPELYSLASTTKLEAVNEAGNRWRSKHHHFLFGILHPEKFIGHIASTEKKVREILIHTLTSMYAHDHPRNKFSYFVRNRAAFMQSIIGFTHVLAGQDFNKVYKQYQNSLRHNKRSLNMSVLQQTDFVSQFAKDIYDRFDATDPDGNKIINEKTKIIEQHDVKMEGQGSAFLDIMTGHFHASKAAKWTQSKLLNAVVKVRARIYVVEKPSIIVVSFRGSEDLLDALLDLDVEALHYKPEWAISNKILIHRGFHAMWKGLKKDTEKMMKKLYDKYTPTRKIEWVVFTGHSLGAACAANAAMDSERIAEGMDPIYYGFSSPLIGNEEFVQQFNVRVPQAWNIYIDGDPVTMIPPVLFERETKIQKIEDISKLYNSGGLKYWAMANVIADLFDVALPGVERSMSAFTRAFKHLEFSELADYIKAWFQNAPRRGGGHLRLNNHPEGAFTESANDLHSSPYGWNGLINGLNKMVVANHTIGS
jgi:hypothetical protein